MRELLVLLSALTTVTFSQLSCHRIPTSFCCTSRIRDQCPEQCATVQCGSEFIHSLFSMDGSRKPSSGAHDGSAAAGRSSGDSDPDSIVSVVKPDQPAVAPFSFETTNVPTLWNQGVNSGDARIGSTAPNNFGAFNQGPTNTGRQQGPEPSHFESATFNQVPTNTDTGVPPNSENFNQVATTPAPSGFPTLIPFSSESNLWSTVTQQSLPPPSLAPRRDPHHRRRTTPDPRIIRPPESLVVIGDYDEDEPPSENAVVDSPQPIPSTTTTTPAPPVISNSGDVFARSRKEISSLPDKESLNSGTASATRNLRDSSLSPPSPHRSGVSRSSAFAFSRAHNRLVCHLTTPGKLICNRPAPRRRFVKKPPRFWRSPEVRKKSPKVERTRKRNFATTRIHITPFMGELARKRRKLDSSSSHEWKVSIIPRGQSKTASVNPIPPLTIDGKSDERFNKFYRTIDKVINKLEITPSGALHVREGEPQIRLEGSTKDLNVESSAVVIVPRTTVAPGVTNRVSVVPFRPLRFTAPPHGGPPGVAPPVPAPHPAAPAGHCGVAPDFTPCVSNEIASKSLLECCKRKNLPPGCQQLCRYNITQAEIRAAMDRGQCGIFNVAPFLECASQGKDNSECCRHRGIVQKTGPQCEQFCRPAQGLSALGVQHIVCGNAVGDMLHCHHSGVRL